jgi:hypothetical protein
MLPEGQEVKDAGVAKLKIGILAIVRAFACFQ